MNSHLMLRTLARSSGLGARPLSTTPARFADDKSMYDKVKDKAGERHYSFMDPFVGGMDGQNLMSDVHWQPMSILKKAYL